MNTNDVYLLNNGEKVKLSPDLAWIFKDDEVSKKKREKFVNDFFGIPELDEMLKKNDKK